MICTHVISSSIARVSHTYMYIGTSPHSRQVLRMEQRTCQIRSNTCVCTYVCMFLNERWEGRKKEASKVKQTNKAKQHSTPKAVTFPRKNELPRVGLEPTTLYVHVHVVWPCLLLSFFLLISYLKTCIILCVYTCILIMVTYLHRLLQ